MDEVLDDGPARHVAQDDQPADQKAEVLRRTEAEGEPGQRGGQKHESDDAQRSRNEGTDGGDGQGRTRAPLPGHGIPVDAGHHRSRLPGNAHQDRGGRPAVHGPVVDSRQQDDRRGGIQAERGRQEHADPGQGTHAGQDPDHRPDQTAQQGIKHVGRCEDRRETEDQILKSRFHQKPHPPLGRGTLSRESKSQNVPKEKPKVKSSVSHSLIRSMTPNRNPSTMSRVRR